ncbi:hypothetical protein MUP79_06370 [Candidatus Bathyarchaeota archaeon]|nr:hypothetical protein [Candidatus Bathyarchaeota archaeon]
MRTSILRIVGFSLASFSAYVSWLLGLSTLRVFVFGGGVSLFFAGCWQLDLLAAQAFWSLDVFIRDRDKPFLLPFNVPIKKQMAYCLFFTWIGIGLFMVMFALGGPIL